jgi:ribonuclease HI
LETGYQRTGRGLNRRRRPQVSPLTRINRSLGRKLGAETLKNLETREPFVVEPWCTPPPIFIEEDREAAEQRHEQLTAGPVPTLAIYTDGSGVHGKVGAAAVAPALNAHAQAYLGRQTTATVYAAELVGMLIGVEMATRSNRGRVLIFTDNQAALKALRNPKRPSGQYILRRTIDVLASATTCGLHIEFHWIPAHRGIGGNEFADRLAKEATGWRETRGRRGRLIQEDTDNTAARPDYLRQLKTPAKTQLNRQLLTWWARDWEKETRGRASHSLTPSPTRTILQLYTSLHKALSSVIIQMRTGKIGLRKFLFQRYVPGITDTTCECGRGEQTVQHVLLSCTNFKDLRTEIWKQRDGRRERMDLREILNKPEQAKKAARFMILTRLLGQYGAILENEIT